MCWWTFVWESWKFLPHGQQLDDWLNWLFTQFCIPRFTCNAWMKIRGDKKSEPAGDCNQPLGVVVCGAESMFSFLGRAKLHPAVCAQPDFRSPEHAANHDKANQSNITKWNNRSVMSHPLIFMQISVYCVKRNRRHVSKTLYWTENILSGLKVKMAALWIITELISVIHQTQITDT